MEYKNMSPANLERIERKTVKTEIDYDALISFALNNGFHIRLKTDGGYMVTNMEKGVIEIGKDYGLTLREIAEYLHFPNSNK